MDKLSSELLKQIADLDLSNNDAVNIRVNGKCVERKSTVDVEIKTKKNKDGIDIFVKPNTKSKTIHIPVLLTQEGFQDCVYNDFYIGENADVVIVAGCGINNCSTKLSEHDGIHTFHIGKNARVKYVEKHLGLGNENSEKILNPTTKINIDCGGLMEMDTTQISGVTFANRKTFAKLLNNATLIIKEKIFTKNNETATTNFQINLDGANSKVDVISRSVAKNNSKQSFKSKVIGNNKCFGHIECDGIIADCGKIISIPEIVANNVDASLVHEAVIGKIAGEQIVKLQTLGLDEKQAEEEIISGFLK